MKLAAIINLWDGEELLAPALARMGNHVDLFIIVYQVISNFGEPHSPMNDFMLASVPGNFRLAKYFPDVGAGGFENERRKRNMGLDIAREHECTHFLFVDCDEFYQDFGKAKEDYEASEFNGSVCPILTYFGRPTYRLENYDGYFVPFIHKLNPDTKAGMTSYPFWCDPTRVVNESDVILLTHPMHHYSWIRKDIQRKARNSSAGQHGNKLRGLLDDYDKVMAMDDPTGHVIKDMGGQRLVVVDDLFNLAPLFVSI